MMRSGIANVYLGRYERVDGSTVAGASLSDLVAAADPALDAEMRAQLDATQAAMQAIKDTADRGEMAYDQMIGEDNPKGNALVQAAIDALLEQTKTIEKIVGRTRSRRPRVRGLRQPGQPGRGVPVGRMPIAFGWRQR